MKDSKKEGQPEGDEEEQPAAKEESMEEQILHDNNDKNISIFDPAVKKKVHGILKLAIAGQIFNIILMVLCVNILFGFAWNPTPFTKEKLKIAVVNADNGLLGQILPNVISRANLFGFNYSFLTLDESHSNIDLMNDVDRGIYTAAFHLNPGSSDSLMNAISNKSANNYNNQDSFSYVWDQGRAGPSYQYIFEFMGSAIPNIVNTYAKMAITHQFSAMGKNTSDINLKVFNQPVGVTLTNLHPVEKNGMCMFICLHITICI